MKYDPISRRMFLRGLGGTLAIPLLPSLLPSIAEAQMAGSPMRFVMALGMFGRDITQWYPKVTDQQMTVGPGVLYKRLNEIDGPMSYILGSDFDPVRSKLNIIRGLDSLQSQGHNSWVPTTACGLDPATADGNGYSIDCVLEESSKFYQTMPSIGVLRSVASRDGGGMWGDFASWSYTSKNVAGQHLFAEWDALSVYNKLFNATNVAKRTATGQRIVSATNSVYDSYKQTMTGRRISSADKYKLDAYMQQLAQIDARMKAVTPACGRAMMPGGAAGNNEQLHSMMIDLEVAALACGLTKVVMHSVTQWETSLSLTGDYHSAAHGGASLLVPATGVSQAATYNKWMMSRVAEFMKKLDQVDEGNGTLLDNTVFIYANEDSTGSHDHKDLPVLIAGGKSKLRQGTFLDYRPRPLVLPDPYSQTSLGRPYNQLLVTAFKALGLSEKDYQRGGLKGFGRYDNINTNLANHYKPFVSSGIDDPLPYLWAA